MDRAVEEPLDVHLPFPSEGESVESQGGADVGKDRLRGGESFVVDETTFHGIDLPFHLLGEALGRRGHVPGRSRPVVFPYGRDIAGIFSKSTEEAVGLVPPELDGLSCP